jgi:hypothetical protein
MVTIIQKKRISIDSEKTFREGDGKAIIWAEPVKSANQKVDQFFSGTVTFFIGQKSYTKSTGNENEYRDWLTFPTNYEVAVDKKGNLVGINKIH